MNQSPPAVPAVAPPAVPAVAPPNHHALYPLPDVGRTFVGGFESTYHPGTGVDAIDVSAHGVHWRSDLDQLADAGVRHLRYPLRWQRIQPTRSHFDWGETDHVLAYLREKGAVPIVDLVHHTSYPDWLVDGFRDEAFPRAYRRFVEAVAARYPWLPAYTLFNEPFATLFLAGHEALWPPYERGADGLRRLMDNVLPAVADAGTLLREALPSAHHVWVDTAEHHRGLGPGRTYAELANDRRHVALDLLLGHDLNLDRPFLGTFVRGEDDPLLHLPRLKVDLLGLDYYSHSEWYYDEVGGRAPSPTPVGFAAVAQAYWERYELPVMLAETNLRGVATDRTSWLRYMVEQYDLALSRGVPLHGYCWFPLVDSADWDSLLARCAGRLDPVGVLGVAEDGTRVRTSFTRAWERAAAGEPVEALPAVAFQAPNDTVLAGYLPFLRHWPWQHPADDERIAPLRADLSEREPGGAAPWASAQPHGASMTEPRTSRTETTRGCEEHSMPLKPAQPSSPTPSAGRDLVVFSHLRWTWVWQRPQHLVSRLAATRAAAGARTWFVEEPTFGEVDHPVLRHEDLACGVTRVWLVVPGLCTQGSDRLDFDDPAAAAYKNLLRDFIAPQLSPAEPDLWLYTPMALDLSRCFEGRVVYDVMDDLAAFSQAPAGLVLRQRRLLAEADVVFTGGPSLDHAVRRQRRGPVHLFRSGVDTAHYRTSRSLRRAKERPVAGYVGVIDERVDLGLVDQLALELPDWTLRMVGPVAKIDVRHLPRHGNLEYPGMATYESLPAVMAGFDVALMPFALNEATRSISPTKTLEYLAAGLPVVSTRVPDVVGDYEGVVHLADDAKTFATACRHVLGDDSETRDVRAAPLARRQEWDTIAESMSTLLAESATSRAAAGEESA